MTSPMSRGTAGRRRISTLEIVAPTLTDFYHCAHCETIFAVAGVGRLVHNQQINEYPEEVKAEYGRLCGWVRETAARYAGRLRLRLVDAFSVEGLWKTLRHRTRTYPLFVLDGRPIAAGWSGAGVERVLRERLGSPGPAPGANAGGLPPGGE